MGGCCVHADKMIWTIPAFLPLSLLQSFFLNNSKPVFLTKVLCFPFLEWILKMLYKLLMSLMCLPVFVFFVFKLLLYSYFHGLLSWHSVLLLLWGFFPCLFFKAPFSIMPDNFLFLTIIFSKAFQILPFNGHATALLCSAHDSDLCQLSLPLSFLSMTNVLFLVFFLSLCSVPRTLFNDLAI